MKKLLIAMLAVGAAILPISTMTILAFDCGVECWPAGDWTTDEQVEHQLCEERTAPSCDESSNTQNICVTGIGQVCVYRCWIQAVFNGGWDEQQFADNCGTLGWPDSGCEE
jgi:hypothetical protein